MAFPWVSATAAEPTCDPLEEVCEPEPSPSSEPPDSEPSTEPSSDPSCQTSLGVYPYPASDPSLPPLPSWASSSDGLRCVVLDVSSLHEGPWKVEQVNEPSPSPGLTTEQGTDLIEEVQSARNLYLFSAGLTICLLAAIFMRSRKG